VIPSETARFFNRGRKNCCLGDSLLKNTTPPLEVSIRNEQPDRLNYIFSFANCSDSKSKPPDQYREEGKGIEFSDFGSGKCAHTLTLPGHKVEDGKLVKESDKDD
jgi:hypothetical protein